MSFGTEEAPKPRARKRTKDKPTTLGQCEPGDVVWLVAGPKLRVFGQRGDSTMIRFVDDDGREGEPEHAPASWRVR